MREQLARTLGRILTATALSGAAVLAAASPGHAATATTTHPATAPAKYISAAGYTGAQVHGTWAGPDVGLVAWTVGTSFDAVKTNAYRSCRSNWTTVSIDVSWNSASLHNGAQLQGHIQSWISNGGIPYPDPIGSGDTITLKQFRRC
jgi:hypothetical protein